MQLTTTHLSNEYASNTYKAPQGDSIALHTPSCSTFQSHERVSNFTVICFYLVLSHGAKLL